MGELNKTFENDNHRIQGNLKTNLKRIAQKIKEGGENGVFKISDMVRATVLVKEQN